MVLEDVVLGSNDDSQGWKMMYDWDVNLNKLIPLLVDVRLYFSLVDLSFTNIRSQMIVLLNFRQTLLSSLCSLRDSVSIFHLSLVTQQFLAPSPLQATPLTLNPKSER